MNAVASESVDFFKYRRRWVQRPTVQAWKLSNVVLANFGIYSFVGTLTVRPCYCSNVLAVGPGGSVP
jgi:hypothetical protein